MNFHNGSVKVNVIIFETKFLIFLTFSLLISYVKKTTSLLLTEPDNVAW